MKKTYSDINKPSRPWFTHSPYGAARDRMLLRDPGLARLTFAVRTIIVLIAVGLLCHTLAVLGDFDSAGVMLGVIAAQLTALLARQPLRRERIATCLVMLPGNWAGILLFHALEANVHLDVIILPMLIAAGFFAQAFSMRLGASLLAAAWIFMFALYLSAADGEPLWHLSTVTLGILIAMLVRFVLWPDDRTLSVKLLVISHRLVLTDFATDVMRQGVDASLTLLQTRMQPVASAIVANLRITEPLRDALADLRLAVEVAVLKETSTGSTVASFLRHESPTSSETDIDRAAQRIDTLLKEVDLSRIDPDNVADSSPCVPAGPARSAMMKRSVQVLVATSLATGFGYLVSEHYWPWAVIVAMFLYLGTESTGHILDKGFNSAVGVLLGVLAGVALTDFLGAVPQLEIVLVPVLLFLAFYLIPVNYAAGIGLITVVLGLVYQLLGLPAPSVLVLRLDEVLIGATAGIVTALLIFPHRPAALLRSRAASLLNALAQTLDPDTAPIHHRELRRQFSTVVTAADLGWLGGLLIERSRVRSSLADLSRLLHLIEVHRSLQTDAVADTDTNDHRHSRLLACKLYSLAAHVCSTHEMNSRTRTTKSHTDAHPPLFASEHAGESLPADHADKSIALQKVQRENDGKIHSDEQISNHVLQSIDDVLNRLIKRVPKTAASRQANNSQ